MKHEEHKLQKWFCELLYYKLILQKKGFFFAIPNGEIRGKDRLQSIITGKRLKDEGVKAGVADLCILLKNQTIFVEMKTETGKQSLLQKEFEKIVKSYGHQYYVLHSIKECEEFLKNVLKIDI